MSADHIALLTFAAECRAMKPLQVSAGQAAINPCLLAAWLTAANLLQ